MRDLMGRHGATDPKVHTRRKAAGRYPAVCLSALLCAAGLVGAFPCTAMGAGDVLTAYQAYERRFESIATIEDIGDRGYEVVEKHVFDIPLVSHMAVVPEGDETLTEMLPAEVVRPEQPYRIGEEDAVTLQQVPTVRFFTAIERDCHRAAVFLADAEGNIVYKTNQLECNYVISGCLEQPITDMISVAFQDLNGDDLMDIILIAGCVNDEGAYAGKTYKVGEVLFQDAEKEEVSFYRDWRINDKINRFDMNRSAKCIRSFVRDGQSAEFLYTATTESELLENGFAVIKEQSYWRNYEKLGKLKVLPGVFSMADYDIFMIYMINEQGDIVWSFQPMGDYDNLYSLRGTSSGRDLDGDGMKDLLVVARYSTEGENGELIVKGQYSIYYQRTGGFDTDVEFVRDHPYREDGTVEDVVNEIRAYWGWGVSELESVTAKDERYD
ncbi:MAG: VCBS repeat-containing protein [Clostridium sp.]|nr:VCBS repeat-containing protein [Acetatifactor muris]MCM1527720.1 hypothetical protein [Bacteroides sp.]MCM1563952.1 VCBS repeat-containing protein [Clostridium sp.]